MKEISYSELKQWEENGKEFQLIDVREQFEREVYDIGGDWYPMSDFQSLMENVEEDIPVVLYCQKGIRSMIVIQRILQLEPEYRLFNLKGGIEKLFN